MDAVLRKKHMKTILTAVIFALLMPLLLWYELENYHMHYGTGTLTMLCAMIGICINGYTIFRNIRAAIEKEPSSISEILCALISLIVCIAVFSVANKIPTCVECDHITSEELGFLSRWIKGIDVP